MLDFLQLLLIKPELMLEVLYTAEDVLTIRSAFLMHTANDYIG